MSFESKYLTEEVPAHIKTLSEYAITAPIGDKDEGLFFGKQDQKPFKTGLKDLITDKADYFSIMFNQNRFADEEGGTFIDLASGPDVDCLNEMAGLGLQEYVAVDLHHVETGEETHPSGVKISRFKEEMLHFVHRMRASEDFAWVFWLCGIEATQNGFILSRTRATWPDIENSMDDPQFTLDTIQAFEDGKHTDQHLEKGYRLLTLYLLLFHQRITTVLNETEYMMFGGHESILKIVDAGFINAQGFRLSPGFLDTFPAFIKSLKR